MIYATMIGKRADGSRAKASVSDDRRAATHTSGDVEFDADVAGLGRVSVRINENGRYALYLSAEGTPPETGDRAFGGVLEIA